MEAKEQVPLFFKTESPGSITIPMGEQWFVKQLIVKLDYLDKVDDSIEIMVYGSDAYFWYIVTGEKKITDFRKDILFVKCALILNSQQIVRIGYKSNYEVWFEGVRTKVS